MIVRAALAATLLVTTGCSSFNRLRTDISAPAPSVDRSTTSQEEQALINGLRKAYRSCQGVGCKGYELDVRGAPIPEFLLSGLTLSDLYCDRFFRASNRSARDRRFARSTTNDVGGAINVILGLAKAGSGISNGVGAGFALGDGLFRNYDESYMVDADLSKMQRLVQAAQDNMKVRLTAAPPSSIFAAETAILRYANLCSFLGMQSLLNDSVSAKTIQIESESTALTGNGIAKESTVPPLPAKTAPAQVPANVSPPPPPGGTALPSTTTDSGEK